MQPPIERLAPPLPVGEPEDDGQHDAEDEAGDDWQVEREAAAPDHDVAWQPPRAELPEPRPEHANGGDHEPDDDQGPRHGISARATASRNEIWVRARQARRAHLPPAAVWPCAGP